MDRQTLIAHVRSMMEVSTLTRTLCDLPGVARVEFQGFEPGAVQFGVDYEDAVPFVYRLRDYSRDWRVLATPEAVELWLTRTDATGAAARRRRSRASEVQESLVIAVLAGMLGVLLLAVAMTASYGRLLRLALTLIAVSLLAYLADYAFRDVLTL